MRQAYTYRLPLNHAGIGTQTLHAVALCMFGLALDFRANYCYLEDSSTGRMAKWPTTYIGAHVMGLGRGFPRKCFKLPILEKVRSTTYYYVVLSLCI